MIDAPHFEQNTFVVTSLIELCTISWYPLLSPLILFPSIRGMFLSTDVVLSIWFISSGAFVGDEVGVETQSKIVSKMSFVTGLVSIESESSALLVDMSMAVLTFF